MLTLDTQTRVAMNTSGLMLISLYTISYMEGTTPLTLRYTDFQESVSYESHSYTAMSIKRTSIEVGSDGRISDVTMSIGNNDSLRTVQNIIENHTIIGNEVKLIEIFVDSYGAFAGGPINTSFLITGAKAQNGQVDFSLSLGFDFLSATLPNRKLFSERCRFRKYKDEYCKSVSTDLTCDMTFTDCKNKGNTLNFGGCPSILNRRLYF